MGSATQFLNGRHGYLDVKNVKKSSLFFQKTWYKAYFVLRYDPIALEEYENDLLTGSTKSHNVGSFLLVKIVRNLKSHPYVFKITLETEKLYFGCDSLILLDEWINSFLLMKRSLQCAFSLKKNSEQVAKPENFHVSIIETKLSENIALKGSYFMFINQSQVSLYLNTGSDEIQRWPLNSILYFSSRPNNKELILLVGKTRHSECGELRFKTSACENIHSLINDYKDRIISKSKNIYTHDYDNEVGINTNNFFKNEHYKTICNATNGFNYSNCYSYYNRDEYFINTQKTCNNIFPDFSKDDEDNGYINENRLNSNKKFYVQYCVSNSSFSNYGNKKDTYYPQNDKSYVKLKEHSKLNLFKSGFTNSSKYKKRVSVIRKKSLISSSPHSSPELYIKRNSRCLSKPYTVNHNVCNVSRQYRRFNVICQKETNFCEKSCKKANNLKEFQELQKFLSKQKSHFKNLQQQMLVLNRSSPSTKHKDHSKEIIPTTNVPFPTTNVPLTTINVPLTTINVPPTTTNFLPLTSNESPTTTNVPPFVPERNPSPNPISKKNCIELNNSKENCGDVKKMFEANKMDLIPLSSTCANQHINTQLADCVGEPVNTHPTCCDDQKVNIQLTSYCSFQFHLTINNVSYNSPISSPYHLSIPTKVNEEINNFNNDVTSASVTKFMQTNINCLNKLEEKHFLPKTLVGPTTSQFPPAKKKFIWLD
ncbi:uncharacterized protein LOC105847980 isoform X1 [Hydra vulgaris]|uniref:uncharacterized protein LOC105847980 isoform X1 n=1 Tax=Hydra vulgaris TaxID=6087 RepID=UPI001F5E6A3F|nr:uncharacterized protein LOC105847980 [Hydra vulgaris]XP_047133016.1 uncharacterized protein LOC105847980 [Hydra vulgaris]